MSIIDSKDLNKDLKFVLKNQKRIAKLNIGLLKDDNPRKRIYIKRFKDRIKNIDKMLNICDKVL